MIIYEILVTILFFILLPFYYIIRACNGKFLYGWKEKMGIFTPPKFDNKVIMYHGVSVGEVIALENLIKKTKETFPDYKIVVTTGTKTGQDIAHKKYKDIADYITYFPFDVPIFVKSFLKKINPDVVLIAETEIWPVFARQCKKMNIPLYIINGRISDSTFKLYKAFAPFFKHIFKYYTGIYTQSKIDEEKLLSLGSGNDKTEVMKNLKFDVKRVESNFDLNIGSNRVIIAGSTHKGEDEIIFNAFKHLKSEFSDIKLIIAPRHLTRIDEVSALAEKTGYTFGYRSKDDKLDKNDILILDTLGELSKIYSICDFAFIGGSFNKTGGHNPLEAAVYSKPTITGPSIHNFRDIYWILDREKAGKIVKTPSELEDYMKKLLSDKDFYYQTCQNCEFVFNDQQGALDFVIQKLKKIL